MGSEDLREFAMKNPNSSTGIELRFFASEVEKERVFKSQNFRPAHIRPGSALVAPIGVMWEPGSWQKTVDMVIKTNNMGVCAWLHEMTDINSDIPYRHLNIMRDSACMYAHDAGFEWVLLIENDIYPDEDLLVKLLNWDMPVVVPYIMDEILGVPICSPHYKKGSGLQPVLWAVFTCMLINTRVLNCFPFAQPFADVGIESGLFQKLRHYGHKVYQDTNTELKITKRPCYPVDQGGLENEWKQWVEIDKRRRLVPNRAPIDPDDKRQVNGIYMPLGMNFGSSSVINLEGADSGTTRETGSAKGTNVAGVLGTTKENRAERRRSKKHKN